MTGLLLAGIGVSQGLSLIQVLPTILTRPMQHVTAGADAQKNFLVVDSKTDTASIESAFERFTEERKDIGIVLINQHVRVQELCDFYSSNADAL